MTIQPNSIYNLDAIELMQAIDDASIDMVLCDLPYGVTNNKFDNIIPIDAMWEQLKRIIKPKSAIVLTATNPFASMLISSNPKMYRHEWVWVKNNSAGFMLANKRPFQICEQVLIFSVDAVQYFPIMEVRGKPRNKSGYSISSSYDIIPRKTKEKSNLYYPKNLLQFSGASQKDKHHPTQKPVPLFEYLIRTYTHEGDLVLDMTAGSGTTALACINTNRRYIVNDNGYREKDGKAWADVMRERISTHTAQKSLFAGES